MDVLSRQLVAEAVRQPRERELARGVGHEVRHADAAADRRDVDDAAFALAAHVRDHGEDPVEGTPEMRLHRVLIVRERHVPDGADLDDARVVDQDVDSSEPLVRLRDRPLGIVPVPDVPGDGEDFGKRLPGANVIDRAVKLLVAARHQRQLRPLMGQFARHDEPKATGPARNDHGLSGKVVIGAPPQRLRGEEGANTNHANDQISFLLFRHRPCSLQSLGPGAFRLMISCAMLPARRTDPAHDTALQTALDRLTAGVERPDTPDGWVTAVRRLPARQAEYAAFPDEFDPVVRAILHDRGIGQLYTHQAAAIGHALAGRNVVITTPTASGKTLCYNAPVLSAILRDASTRALYLFPTKALAQDQLAELHELSDQGSRRTGHEIGVFTYDGDTPQDARRAIRGRAHVVLSNPDMIHSGILPHHPRWAKLFENLKFVVIDELHAYRGVFGSHLTNVLRRLRRICGHYGSHPVFICSSATIANPRDLAAALVEQPFELVSESGAPRGEKFFLFVNPPVVNQQLGIRRSYLAETRRIASEFLKRKLQLIVFTQSRLTTEILTTYLKDDFDGPSGTREQIRGYRGGYLPQRRREIEKGLREGSVRAVVSTNALELGIDIGALDACVMAGYPGTIAATWQRAGRAGRRSGRSAAVLVASSAPLDQFVVRNPSYFFDAAPEHALINPDNLHILVDHVKCAAFELPFTTSETYGRHDVQEVLGILAESGLVHRTGDAPEDGGATDVEGQWQWTSESYPADAVSLRSISSDNFVIVDTTEGADVIGETSFTSGPATLHEKAIYMLEGVLYQVERLDFEGRKAFVRRIDCDYYTDAITYTKVTVLETFASEST